MMRLSGKTGLRLRQHVGKNVFTFENVLTESRTCLAKTGASFGASFVVEMTLLQMTHLSLRSLGPVVRHWLFR